MRLMRLCDEPVYRGSMAEGPAAVVPSAPEETPGWRRSGAGPALFGVLPATSRTLRTPWLVLPRIKDISPRKRVTCDKNGGSHGRDRQVREILSPGLRSRRIRRNGKEAVRGS